MLSKRLGILVLLSSTLALTVAIVLGASTPFFDPFSAAGSYSCVGTLGDTDCDPPANDDFVDALDISETSLPTTIGPQQTKNSTLELGEPSPCGGKASTVWYRFRPTVDAVVDVDTFGSDYDTALAAYAGTSMPSLISVACNDDIPGFLVSRISFQAIVGQTYYLQVGGFSGDAGQLFLNVESTSQQGPDMKLSADHLSVVAGATAALELQADISGSNLAAYTVDVFFDPLFVAVVACEAHSTGVCNAAFSPDSVRITGVSTDGLSGGVSLAEITFESVPGAAGCSQVLISAVELIRTDGAGLVASINHGEICIAVSLTGDVDCSGLIGAIDALLLLQFTGGVTNSLPCADNADANSDGRVNSLDAALILQFNAGLIGSLPI